MDMHVTTLTKNLWLQMALLGVLAVDLGGQVYLVTHKRPPQIGGLFIFDGSASRVFRCVAVTKWLLH